MVHFSGCSLVVRGRWCRRRAGCRAAPPASRVLGSLSEGLTGLRSLCGLGQGDVGQASLSWGLPGAASSGLPAAGLGRWLLAGAAAWLAVAVVEGVGSDCDSSDQLAGSVEDGDHRTVDDYPHGLATALPADLDLFLGQVDRAIAINYHGAGCQRWRSAANRWLGFGVGRCRRGCDRILSDRLGGCA